MSIFELFFRKNKKPVDPNAGYDMATYIKYYDILYHIHGRINPKVYLEVGVRDGDSILKASSQTRVIA